MYLKILNIPKRKYSKYVLYKKHFSNKNKTYQQQYFFHVSQKLKKK